MYSKSTPSDYLVDSSLAEEAIECRRHGYVLTGKFLGQGAYAKVYLGQAVPEKIKSNYKLRKIADNQKDVKVAIKIISTSTAPEIYITKFLPREAASMNKCYMHSNVIQLFDMFASRSRVYLILEYADYGDLLTYVNQCYSRKGKENCISEEKARTLFRDILAGIQFVHNRGVAHRDLKCENILLGRGHRAKLSDFGFAIELKHGGREMLKTHCGSYAYAPPEILKQQKYDGRLADLWSLGVILFAMVNGGLPFKESDAKAVLAAMKTPVYYRAYLSSDCKDLISGLLRVKPQKRYTLAEVFAHSWMRKHSTHAEQADKKAFGDVSNTEAKTDLLAGTGLKLDDYSLGSERYTNGFDNPENVLRYIKECMGNLGSSKNNHQHGGKRALESCKLQVRPKQHVKPHFLHTMLACDNSGDPPAPSPSSPPAATPDKYHYRTFVPSPPKSRAAVGRTGGGGHGRKWADPAAATPGQGPKTGSSSKKSATLRIIPIDDGDMVVCGGPPRTTLPQVQERRERTSTATGSSNSNSRKTRTSGRGSESPQKSFKVKYEVDRSSGYHTTEDRKSPTKTKKKKKQMSGRATVDPRCHQDAQKSLAGTPNVINIKINNNANAIVQQHNHGHQQGAHRPLVGSKGLRFVKAEPIPALKPTSESKEPGFVPPVIRRGGGALSVPPPSELQAVKDEPRSKECSTRPEKNKDCNTVKYNLTCSHGFKKNRCYSRKSSSNSPQQPSSKTETLTATGGGVFHRASRLPASSEHHDGFIRVTPIGQNVAHFGQYRKQAADEKTYGAGPKDVVASQQAWSAAGNSPASTKAGSYASTMAKYKVQSATYRTASHVTTDGGRKLLHRRSQEMRNIFHGKGQRAAIPTPSAAAACDRDTAYRIVLKMTNKT